MQAVPAPVEGRPGFAAPATVARYTKRIETRRYRACGLNRLLIEACLLSTLVIKALRTDGHKVVVGFAVLRFQEPTQRLETGRHHAIVRTGGAHDKQCLGES